MSRSYKIPFEVACTAATELASGLVASGKFAQFTGFTLNDADAGSPLPTSQQLTVAAYLIPTPTGGRSGGAVSAPIADDTGDSAATTGGRAGDTTLTTGTAGALGYQGGCYVTQGIVYRFDPPIPALGGQEFVLQLVDAPTGTVTLSGTLNFSEMGG